MSRYAELEQFIGQKMQMQHIYQPVMLLQLLQGGGEADTSQIAQAILDKDPSQLEYYAAVVTNMVGKVLTQSRKLTVKSGKKYALLGFQELSSAEVGRLTELCQNKILEFETKRQGAQWEHRRRGHRPVSGSVRYEVLKRANFRCELCGISADLKGLEVDHIHPKSLGGKDELGNYQALCYSCNAAKRNTDNSDFRKTQAFFEERKSGCLFCDLPNQDPHRIVAENHLAYVIRDGFPVTLGHSLFIPKRHVEDYFGLTTAEVNSINQLMSSEKTRLMAEDPSITGFNIGMNCGESAGQTVFHCHVHLIPRRRGDVESPRGGVRHLIPGKGHY